MKRNKGKKIAIITFIIGCIMFLVGLILLLFNKKTQKPVNNQSDNKLYPVLSANHLLNDYELYELKNGYFIALKNDKYYLMDTNWQIKDNLEADFIEYYGNMIIVTPDFDSDGSMVYDANMNLLYENVTVGEETHCDDQLFAFKDNKNAILVDENGQKLLDGYDSYVCYDNYILADKKQKTDVYDQKPNLLLDDVLIADLTQPQYSSFAINDSYIIIKDANKFKAYYVKTQKLSDSFTYITFNEDYLGVSDGKTITLYDELGTVVASSTDSASDFAIVTKDIIAKKNTSCKNDNNEFFTYYDLYNINGEKISKDGCNIVNIDSGYTIETDANYLYTIYDHKGVLFTYQGAKDSYLYPNEHGYFIYSTTSGAYKLLDKTGKSIHEECHNYIEQKNENVLICETTPGLNYVYVDDKLVFNRPYKNIEYVSDNYLVVQNENDLFGLYDIEGHQILEEKYRDFNFLYNNFLTFNYQYQQYVKLLNWQSRKDYEAFLKTDQNVLDNPDFTDVIDDVTSAIKKYDVSDYTDLINAHTVLFKRLVYHIENNKNITIRDGKYFLHLFPAIIDYESYQPIEALLHQLDTLKIFVFKTKPSDMRDFSAGEYHYLENTIYIMENDYDYAMYHELMHFISFSIPEVNAEIYACNNQIKSYQEVMNLSFAEQGKCEVHYVDYNSLLEEAGAEYFAKVFYDDLPYQSYRYSNIAYTLLQYILDINIKDIEFANNKIASVYLLLAKKLNYSYDEATKLLTALHNLNQVEQEYIMASSEQAFAYYQIADELVKAYESKKVGSWQDNDYVYAALNQMLLYTDVNALNRFLKDNPKEKITYLEELKKFNNQIALPKILKKAGYSEQNAYDYYFVKYGDNYKITLEYNPFNGEPSTFKNIYFDLLGNILKKD